MSLVSFSDLISPVTLANWKAAIVSTASLVGLQTENWAEGGYTRTLVALFAKLYTTAGDVVRIIAASGFLDFAEGKWLTLLAKQVFNVDRVEATYASAPNAITLTNGGGGLYVFAAGDVVVANTSTGKTYRNTSGGTLNPGIGQTLLLDLAAEAPGSGSNALVGAIAVMVTTFLGVTCSNDVALVGLDEESDPDLRQRCRDSLALLALGGIKRAYEFIAKSAKQTDGTPIGVTRVRVMPAPGDGTLTVYIAGASGAIGGLDVAVVQSDFDTKVTPYGFTAAAVSAANVSISAPATIWIPASLGLTNAEAQAAVLAALETYVNTLPIGGVVISPSAGKVYWRALLAVVANAIPGTLKAQLTSELDLPISDNEVPVFGGILADTTINQVT